MTNDQQTFVFSAITAALWFGYFIGNRDKTYTLRGPEEYPRWLALVLFMMAALATVVVVFLIVTFTK